jgi:hypothetical protein
MHQNNLLRAARYVAVIFALSLLFSAAANAQTARLKIECLSPNEKSERVGQKKKEKDPKKGAQRFQPSSETQKAPTPNNGAGQLNYATILLACNATATWYVWGGPPNTSVVLTLTQSNPNNIVGFKWNAADPNAVTLQIPVTLDSSGNGESQQFLIRGLMLGETDTTADLPGYISDTVRITVTECNCPPIFLDIPPRT